MTRPASRVVFLTACLLLLLGTTSSLASGGLPTSPLQPDPGLSCSIADHSTGPYSALINGTVSGGVPPYHWTLGFGDGISTSGTIGFSGGSYSASHTYSTNGTFTAEFSAADSSVAKSANTCGPIYAQVTITGLITVNATVAESIGVTDVPSYTLGQSLTEMISLTDTAFSPAAAALRETIGLVDTAANVAQNLLTEIISLLDTGHLTSSSAIVSAITSSSTSGGGTSPFPLQYIALPVIGVVAVLSFLLLRWFRSPSAKR